MRKPKKARKKKKSSMVEAWFREAFDKTYANDELERDEDAIVSIGDEGAFVACWRWISNEEAGINHGKA